MLRKSIWNSDKRLTQGFSRLRFQIDDGARSKRSSWARNGPYGMMTNSVTWKGKKNSRVHEAKPWQQRFLCSPRGFCFISSTCVDLWGEGAIGGWSNTASPEEGGSTEDLCQHAGVTYVVIDNLSLAMARIYLPGIFFLWQIWLPVEWRSCETVLEERTNSAQRLFQLEYGLFRASAADSVF